MFPGSGILFEEGVYLDLTATPVRYYYIYVGVKLWLQLLIQSL